MYFKEYFPDTDHDMETCAKSHKYIIIHLSVFSWFSASVFRLYSPAVVDPGGSWWTLLDSQISISNVQLLSVFSYKQPHRSWWSCWSTQTLEWMEGGFVGLQAAGPDKTLSVSRDLWTD